MIAGGILLFVATHWDALPPRDRFLLVLVLVGAFHVFGALAAERFPGMAATLHAIGTVRDGRSERVNMGAVIFAATVMTFYFSEVMDKLGRSASLIGLGFLFLAGGWALERTRRRLVHQVKESV